MAKIGCSPFSKSQKPQKRVQAGILQETCLLAIALQAVVQQIQALRRWQVVLHCQLRPMSSIWKCQGVAAAKKG